MSEEYWSREKGLALALKIAEELDYEICNPREFPPPPTVRPIPGFFQGLSVEVSPGIREGASTYIYVRTRFSGDVWTDRVFLGFTDLAEGKGQVGGFWMPDPEHLDKVWEQTERVYKKHSQRLREWADESQVEQDKCSEEARVFKSLVEEVAKILGWQADTLDGSMAYICPKGHGENWRKEAYILKQGIGGEIVINPAGAFSRFTPQAAAEVLQFLEKIRKEED